MHCCLCSHLPVKGPGLETWRIMATLTRVPVSGTGTSAWHKESYPLCRRPPPRIQADLRGVGRDKERQLRDSALRPSNRHKKESIGLVYTWSASYSISQYQFSKPRGQNIKPCSFSIMLQPIRLCFECLPCSQNETVVRRQSKPQHVWWLESIDSTTAVNARPLWAWGALPPWASPQRRAASPRRGPLWTTDRPGLRFDSRPVLGEEGARRRSWKGRAASQQALRGNAG